MENELGTIRVSPQVIAAIVALAAAAVPGVACLNAYGRPDRPLYAPEELGRAVRVNVRADAVHADVYLTVKHRTNMTQVGYAVQQEVGEAIRRMLGLDVQAVDVYIVDVAR